MTYKIKVAWIALLTAKLCAQASIADKPTVDKPNIIYILADDLGYGDVQAMTDGKGKIPTPNIDRLAKEGMLFTDAHSGSAVCTPTRYGVLTGRYAWRTRLQQHVLYGHSPHLIDPDGMSVADVLKNSGYQTACIGKWHLGMDWTLKEGAKPPRGIGDEAWGLDYTVPIENGPLSIGFDTFFGISASLDMPPYVYIRDRLPTAVPTETRTYRRKGAAAEDFEAKDVLPRITEETVKLIDEQGRALKEGEDTKPLFIYLAYNSPHTPHVPNEEWEGSSGLNSVYADFVAETDGAVGAVMDALERNGTADNTLLIFTSDNGCSPAANIHHLRGRKHYPNGGFRGAKADIWDGGHRVPFICRWPGKIQPGARSDRLVCLTDLMATCAEIVGTELPDHAGVDSVSMLDTLLGNDREETRSPVVHHSIQGVFAIRDARWKLIFGPGSGGWSHPKGTAAISQGQPPIQLYDMIEDPNEENNLQAKHPEKVERLTALMRRYIDQGRSTPGTPQANDIDNIKLYKVKAP